MMRLAIATILFSTLAAGQSVPACLQVGTPAGTMVRVENHCAGAVIYLEFEGNGRENYATLLGTATAPGQAWDFRIDDALRPLKLRALILNNGQMSGSVEGLSTAQSQLHGQLEGARTIGRITKSGYEGWADAARKASRELFFRQPTHPYSVSAFSSAQAELDLFAVSAASLRNRREAEELAGLNQRKAAYLEGALKAPGVAGR